MTECQSRRCIHLIFANTTHRLFFSLVQAEDIRQKAIKWGHNYYCIGVEVDPTIQFINSIAIEK